MNSDEEEEEEMKVDKKPKSVSKGKKGKQMDELEEKFCSLIKQKNLKSVTVPDLKEFLTVKNLPSQGNKAFLMEVIQEYFENEFKIN
jgi:hypothetical protein